jgi:hypothetical protein
MDRQVDLSRRAWNNPGFEGLRGGHCGNAKGRRGRRLLVGKFAIFLFPSPLSDRYPDKVKRCSLERFPGGPGGSAIGKSPLLLQYRRAVTERHVEEVS